MYWIFYSLFIINKLFNCDLILSLYRLMVFIGLKSISEFHCTGCVHVVRTRSTFRRTCFNVKFILISFILKLKEYFIDCTLVCNWNFCQCHAPWNGFPTCSCPCLCSRFFEVILGINVFSYWCWLNAEPYQWTESIT